MTTLFIKVDYEKYNPETYKGVYVTDQEENKIIQVNTNDFDFDFDTVLQFISEYKKYNEEIENVVETRSLGHYAMDRDGGFEHDGVNTGIYPTDREIFGDFGKEG